VQSVPSPKAEPIKPWLAKVGYERMQMMSDPSRALDRARETWQKHGRSEKWIQQRMTGQETRNKLTDYWADHDIRKGEEFAILTNRWMKSTLPNVPSLLPPLIGGLPAGARRTRRHPPDSRERDGVGNPVPEPSDRPSARCRAGVHGDGLGSRL
jgi:hypothetical protein